MTILSLFSNIKFSNLNLLKKTVLKIKNNNTTNLWFILNRKSVVIVKPDYYKSNMHIFFFEQYDTNKIIFCVKQIIFQTICHKDFAQNNSFLNNITVFCAKN